MKPKAGPIEGRFRGRAAELAQWLDTAVTSRPEYYHPVRVCGLFGAIRALSTLSGAVPLVHGTASCSYFQKFQIVVSFDHPVVAPATNMNEYDIVHGGEDKLHAAILDVDRRYRPELIAVLNTCTPAIIGDDVHGVAHAARAEINARYMLVVDADGLQYYHQGYGYNNVLEALVNDVMQEENIKIPHSVNLFGEVIGGESALSQDKYILRDLLARSGIIVNSILPADASVRDVERAPRAMLNVTRCAPMADTAAQLMDSRFGVPYVSMPMPYGLYNTDRWLETIALRVGRERAARKVIAAEHKRLYPIVHEARSVLSGQIAAVHGGPGRVIANIAVAQELGMKVGLVSLFFSTSHACEQVLEQIDHTGEDPEIMIDCSVEELRTATDELGIQVWFGNSLDFPETFERTGITACETLIYQTPYVGYTGYENALKHFIQRKDLSGRFGACRRRKSRTGSCRRGRQ